MENKEEDEIRKRWEIEAKEKEQQQGTAARPRKRLRELEYNTAGTREDETPNNTFERVKALLDRVSPAPSDATLVGTVSNRGRQKKGNGRRRQTRTRGASTAARGKTAEADEDYIELD